MRKSRRDSEPVYSTPIDEFGYPIEEEPQDEQEEQPRKKKKSFARKLLWRLCLVGIVVLLAELAILLYSGEIWFNEPKKKDYPVRGPVMDNDGGEIYWTKFSKQNIQMCYLRATKSTSYVDESFEKNWKGASKSAIPVGALHIFDMRADGAEQAENYLSAVGDLTGRLTPAVEISPGLFDRIFAPNVNTVGSNLRAFADRIKERTGVYPIIKCSSHAYEKYVRGEFDDCMLWYESKFSQPESDIDWDFWEYTDRTRLLSHGKDSERLEMSVFRHDEEKFKSLLIV